MVSITYDKTSDGSPYFEYTSAFACVYPYGPDLNRLHTIEPYLGANALGRAVAELCDARNVRGRDILYRLNYSRREEEG